MVALETSNDNFFSTTLTSSISDTDTTIPVASLGGLTSPAYIVINPNSDSEREVVFADGTWTGTDIVLSDTSGRGRDGSAGDQAHSHTAGTLVVSVPLKQHIEDLHDRIDSHTHDGNTNDSTITHSNLGSLTSDDHTIYLKADGTRALTGPLDLANGTVAAPSLAFASDGDTGLYRIAADNLGVAIAGAKVLDVSGSGLGITGTLTASGAATLQSSLDVTGVLEGSAQIRTIDGTAAVPAFSFTSGNTSGLYLAGPNNPAFSVSGTKVIDIDSGGLNVTGDVDVTNDVNVTGSVRFSGTGIVNAAAGDLIFRTAGVTRGYYDDSLDAWRWFNNTTEAMRLDGNALDMLADGNISTNGALILGDGSIANPGLRFHDDLDTGIYRRASGEVGITGNGDAIAYFGVSGNEHRMYLGAETNDWIGYDTTNEIFFFTTQSANRVTIRDSGIRIEIDGSAAAPSIAFNDPDTGFYHSSSLNQISASVDANQELVIGQTGFLVPNVYNSTTASAANVHVASNGSLQRSTSSSRYKQNIKARRADQNRSILDLTPSEFDGMEGNPARGVPLKPTGERLFGLIAEDVAANFPAAAIYDEDGRPDAIDWNAVTAAILSIVQQHEERLDTAGL